MKAGKKIGLIAGSGSLPHEVIMGAQAQGYDVFVAALDGIASPENFSGPSESFGFAELYRMMAVFKTNGCTHVTMAGNVSRPDFRKLKPGVRGMMLLPKVIKAASKGDDALLAFLMSVFEKEGFEILAPQELCVGSLIDRGPLGAITPAQHHQDDIDKALFIAAKIGAHDIGQGAVVCRGLVLAVEAQEGTDKMLERVADLDDNLRGTTLERAGVLAKCLKPGQEERVDLPTIGVATIERAAKAGLAGIVLVAGKAFVMDKPNVRALADKYGLFVLGYDE